MGNALGDAPCQSPTECGFVPWIDSYVPQTLDNEDQVFDLTNDNTTMPAFQNGVGVESISDIINARAWNESTPASTNSSNISTTAEFDSEPAGGQGVSPSLSPLSMHSLNANNQQATIKKGLLKIYHDSLEGALSCWLTERNCPYVVSRFASREAWGSTWTNRITLRICALERATASTSYGKDRNDAQASHVLDLAITAFAAQWMHTNAKSDLQWSPNVPRSETDFDRTMQKTLWHQAFQALTQAASNLSFKVILALIIFSLTQRPCDNVGTLAQGGSMQEILQADATPMFLEVALRQLHQFRRSLLFDSKMHTKSNIGPEAKDAFNMLFWLAVMFDTLSASMYQRSFVVRDEESAIEKNVNPRETTDTLEACDLDGWCGNPRPVDEGEIELWGEYFLKPRSRSGDERRTCTRWPCSYDDAASALCDAAPVKVLLFRRVGQLRDLVCAPSGTPIGTIESAIDNALDVYDHWNKTYGLFIADCIANHEDLPARVQSWYILLAGHWHLAVFSLATLIDDVDGACLSDGSHRRLRKMSNFTHTLRSQSAIVVSELGRVSHLNRTDSSFSQSGDFHFAVSKAALLTEPWTAVLVQTFGRAGEFLIQEVRHGRLEVTRQQVEYCIAALSVLSRKSDMALQAQQFLTLALQDLE